jgi:phosphoglycerate dehydrogenase-like enzyme
VARTIDILTHVSSPEVDAIARDVPEARFTPIPEDGPLPEGLRGEVCLTLAWGSPNMRAVIERGVRWVHTIGTGVDRFPIEAIGDDAVLTCSRGGSAVPISEWTLGVMLAFEKRLPESWISEPPKRWNIAELGGLHGKTLGLVGLGGIATEVARRALAFGMRVVAFRRSVKPAPLPGIELERDLAALVARSDHLVVAASATPATRHLIDAERLARARPGLHLVNIARGSLIDQDALRRALDEERIARASLDVCDPEPLPAGHWLYSHPRVRLSPHISWSMPGALTALYDSFRENLRRYLADEPLEGIVDLEQGY